MPKIAFLGAGRMAGAMVTGLLAKKVFEPGQIICTSGPDDTAEKLAERTGIHATRSLDELLPDASVVIAAFKPQQLQEIDPRVSELTRGALLLSILAGSRIDVLGKSFPYARNIVRVMPNSPGQIGAGISAFAFRDPPSAEDRTLVENILGSLGEAVELPEAQMDAVTGLSGSGPAYVFEFICALRDGGIKAGLAPDVAHKLALATVAGAARLAQESGIDPEKLREQVTSPGGTTLAGLQEMEKHGFRSILVDTVLAAQKRSRELSGG